ncbi:unnamed protein product, partial [Rotaria magnacalcarata]
PASSSDNAAAYKSVHL